MFLRRSTSAINYSFDFPSGDLDLSIGDESNLKGDNLGDLDIE